MATFQLSVSRSHQGPRRIAAFDGVGHDADEEEQDFGDFVKEICSIPGMGHRVMVIQPGTHNIHITYTHMHTHICSILGMGHWVIQTVTVHTYTKHKYEHVNICIHYTLNNICLHIQLGVSHIAWYKNTHTCIHTRTLGWVESDFFS